MNSYELPNKLDKEIDELESLISAYLKGQISFNELKAHRVPFGIYEQRKQGTYMLRIRCAGGIIKPLQLKRISEIAAEHNLDQLHLTTRQEIQIHYVKLENIVPLLCSLRQTGLASRGGGGNTVRNITAQEDAGVDPEEIFDVEPYTIALTSRLIAEDDSWTLPRKFKIAFSGSRRDKGYATLADLGFIARKKDDDNGFCVYAAGGMGAKSSESHLLFDFIPQTEVYNITKAVKNLFWKNGNRKNKHTARLRFLWQSLGEKEFKDRFTAEYASVKKENYPALQIQEIENTGFVPLIEIPKVEHQDFSLWKKRFVYPQKQAGLFSLLVPIELGFISCAKAKALAEFIAPFGENVLRFTKEQNILLRNIQEKYLSCFYQFLKEQFANFNRPLIYDTLISCAGASTCQLGICLSRGAAKAAMQELEKSRLDLDLLSGIKINISGCPNACGQHPAADLGFFGKAGRKAEKLYPAYNVVAGAVISDGRTKLATKVGEASARDLPALVKEFLALYLSREKAYKNFSEYISQEGILDLEKLCQKYKNIPEFTEDRNYYFDWGAEEAFSLAGRGSGECSAGIFDLIEVDLNNLKEIKEKLSQLPIEQQRQKQTLLERLVFYASRMLLITRGLEPKSESQVYDNFNEHFIATGLVSGAFKEITQLAQSKDYAALAKLEEKIYQLAERVEFLYQHMDNAFQFQVPEGQASGQLPSAVKAKMVKDLRGVACPMNFVKTKVELAKLKPKELLEIWLDDGEPIDNVPGSVKAEGHKIISQARKDGYWSVVIEKS